MLDKPVFSGFRQVALVVKDCYATVEKYADEYGIGPWTFYEFNPDTVQDMQVHGRPQEHAMRLAVAYIGDVEIELIEPLDDKSIYAKFLKKQGEGLHHVALNCENYDKTLQFFQEKGLNVLQRGNWHGCRYSYIDTTQDLGLIAEIYGAPPDFEAPEPDDIYPKND